MNKTGICSFIQTETGTGDSSLGGKKFPDLYGCKNKSAAAFISKAIPARLLVQASYVRQARDTAASLENGSGD
jgi:hypothetical protein